MPITSFKQLREEGVYIAGHGYGGGNYTNTTGMTIDGPASSTMTVTDTTLVLKESGSTIVTYTFSDAASDAIGEICAAIEARANYTCSGATNHYYSYPIVLANLTDQDISTSYNALITSQVFTGMPTNCTT